MPVPLLWSARLGRELLAKEDAKVERAKRRAKVHRCYQYDRLESYQEYTSSGRRRLESLEAAMRYLFAKGGVKLGYMQKRLVDVVIIAMLHKMFGADLVSNLKYLHKKYLIDELNDTVAIIFPRRSGKTEGSAIMIALIAVSQPHGNCIMYNLTATQAKEFLASVIKHLDVFKDSEEFGWTEVKRDVRQLIEIRARKYDTCNSVKSYPSALKGDAKIDWSDCEGPCRRRQRQRNCRGTKRLTAATLTHSPTT